MLTRRDLIRSAVALAVLPPARKLLALSDPPGLTARLVKEFGHSRAMALSPDGTKLGLEDWKAARYPFRFVEFGTWRTIRTDRLWARVFDGGFFAGTQTLFLVSLGSRGQQHVTIDLNTGARTEHDVPAGSIFLPLGEGMLLVQHYEGKGADRKGTLALVEFPSYREQLKVPYEAQPRRQPPVDSVTGIQLGTECSVVTSGDAASLAYAYDKTLVCRRTKDLGVLWERTVEPEMQVYTLSISRHGERVAAAIADDKFQHPQHPKYIAIYDGKTGTEITRLPLDATKWGMGFSPDVTLMTVVKPGRGKKNETMPTVDIYDISSGRRLASVVHDRFNAHGREFLLDGCSAGFTPDGKYLITSAMVTKVWELARAGAV